MNKKQLLLLLSVFFMWTSCQNQSSHFITDEAYRTQVETDLQARQADLTQGDLFPAEREGIVSSSRGNALGEDNT